jgi:hypothetical protein
MPLYQVIRTDTVLPGEFDNAYVIAGGTAQAREAVRGLFGVPKSAELLADKVDVSAPRGGGKIRVLSTYYDEREAMTPDSAETPLW